MKEDLQYLQLLSIFHYIVGGLLALFACIPLIHLTVGIVMIVAPPTGPNAPPAFVGWLFVLIASVIILGGWTLAACIAYAGWCLAQRRHYTFCLVAAGLSCLWTPFGTVLGVFTILVLLRPSVKALFTGERRPDWPAADEDGPPADYSPRAERRIRTE